jgi:Fic family protein
MSEVKHLWPVETGITDLPENWQELAIDEVASLATIWEEQRDRLKGSAHLKGFTDQLSREWAIETGIIENLYEIERGVTQTLIERGFQAALLEHGSTNKPRDYVIQLLKDQQEALEGLFDFVSNRRSLTVSYVKELHAALCRSQADVDAVDATGKPMKVDLIRGTWKMLPNYPERDGVVFMYCPPEHVASEMDRLVELHNQHVEAGVPPEIEAAWLHHRFSIIHPFQDGNGRVARALASLVLIQRGLFPLVVTRDDKVAYLDALEAADNGDLNALTRLFGKLQRVQFRKATAISESILSQQAGVKQALQGLLEAVSKKELEQQRKLEKVFEHAGTLETVADKQLNAIVPQLEAALKRLDPFARAGVDRSTKETDYYFRGQIVEVAKHYLHYFADTGPYRSWVRLRLTWSRRAQVVFTFHSIGGRFAGVLVVAPFLEFRDDEDDNDPRATLINLAQEPFTFFYNEESSKIERRFEDWLDDVLTTMLAELQQNL